MKHLCADVASQHFSHFVHFYENEVLLTDSIAEFARTALRNGDALVLIVTRSRKAAIEAKFPEISSATGDSCLFVDSESFLSNFLINRCVDEQRFYAAASKLICKSDWRASKVHVFDELAASLWSAGNHQSALRLEELWNSFGQDRQLSLYCAFPISLFSGMTGSRELARVCDLHQHVMPTAGYSPESLHDRICPMLLLRERALSLEAEVQQRRAAEAATRASEERFRSLALATAGLVWTADSNGEIQLIERTEEALRVTGPNIERLRGSGWLEVVHPDDRSRVLATWQETLQLKRPVYMQYRICGEDGSIRHIGAHAAPVLNSDGTVREWVGSCIDLTGQKAADQKLQRNESFLRMANRVARIGAWAVDLASNELSWSDQVREIHEVPGDFQPTVDAAINFYLPGCRERIRVAVEQCCVDGVPFDLELQILTYRGRRIWVRAIGEAERNASGVVTRIQGAFQDISEQKTAVDKTEQLARRLTATLESITDGFCLFDREWRFTYINERAAQMLRLDIEKLTGKVLWEEFPDAVGTTFEKEYRRALAENRPTQFEEFYQSLSMWLEVRAFPTDEGLAIYFRDVTQEKLSREQLRQSEERFNLLCKATNDVIWDWDLANDNVWWSDALKTVFGETGQPDTSIHAWKVRIHHDDLHRVAKKLETAIADGQQHWFDEYRFRRGDGSYAHVLDRGFIIRNADQNPIRMVGAMTDMTARKETEARLQLNEQRLRNAQRIAALGSWDYDFRTGVLVWSDEMYKVFGIAKESFVPDYSGWFRYVHPQDKQRVQETVDAACREHKPLDYEHRVVTPDGQVRFVHERGELIYDPNTDEVVRMSGTTQDITERKKLETQFLRAQRMESIGTLAGGIAHDLNNVLAPIMMAVALLKERVHDEEGQALLESLECCSQRGADLIRQVLSFSRGVEGARAVVNPVHLVRELQKIVSETFPKNISCSFLAARDLLTVVGDATQLHQVLMNLCVNARDAMPAGGQITLFMQNAVVDEVYAGMNPGAKPGTYVLLKVSDTGTGVPAEIRDKIFEPFFTTKETGRGTGLGLSTTLAIIRSHGGFITLDSEVGKGSSFSVYLPANPQQTCNTGDTQRFELPRGNGELILVVDDEQPIREVTKKTLERFGYRVLVAANGAEALGIYATHAKEVALVLTDMAMPVLDGPSTITALRAISPDVKIIGCSGFASDDIPGVLRFIPKPYTAETMLRVFADVLRPSPSLTTALTEARRWI